MVVGHRDLQGRFASEGSTGRACGDLKRRDKQLENGPRACIDIMEVAEYVEGVVEIEDLRERWDRGLRGGFGIEGLTGTARGDLKPRDKQLES